jgi:hypothetical protein
MGVWFHSLYADARKSVGGDFKPKFYSIENSDKRTKGWTIKNNKEKIINEIVMNFRYDDGD